MGAERRTICITLLPSRPGGNWRTLKSAQHRTTSARCYHHIEMRPESIGRVFGIGIRVAGRVAAQRMAASEPSRVPQSVPAGSNPRSQGRPKARSSGSLAQGLTRGVSGFLKHFRRAGGIVWLQVTGVFFFLPVLVFVPTLWRTRMSYAHGPDHRTFIASAIVVVVFFYLGISSFWRARKR